MNAPLAQRELTLAAIALLAVVLAVALTRVAGGEDQPGGAAQASPATDWKRAHAAPYSFPRGAKRTACGQPTGPKTLGLAHPVLPCGAKITILFDGRQVLTQIVDRGAGLPGREFDVTPGLAEAIGLTGLAPIEWRFASPSEASG